MAELSDDAELSRYFGDDANGSRNDNKRNLSPSEDYNPLEECT